jgi:hypothetical protein
MVGATPRALEGEIPDFPAIPLPLPKRQSQLRLKACAKGGAADGAGLATPGSDPEIQAESPIRAIGSPRGQRAFSRNAQASPHSPEWRCDATGNSRVGSGDPYWISHPGDRGGVSFHQAPKYIIK